ncbi:MAG: excinuclease ABC subunit A, partial [Bacteroidales bacterium]|nr:excinuclease ABC subunit A [Bacteroidales bacterium]
MAEREYITITGARVNNLKNISLKIPRGKLCVVTGVSGSGKSSLAFDTLYAEGQRRFAESLSSFARQFLGRMSKPDVDKIEGIPPAIAIQQKVTSKNPRSTVGTTTEIYDYLRILFSKIGHTFSPVSGREVKKESAEDVMEFINTLPQDSKVYILSKVPYAENERIEKILSLTKEGHTRFFEGGKVVKAEKLVTEESEKGSGHLTLLISRLVIGTETDESELRSYIEDAFKLGEGRMTVACETQAEAASAAKSASPAISAALQEQAFSQLFECDGITFQEPNEQMFSFNSPIGACPVCGGFGTTVGIDEKLVIPNASLSLYEDAVAPWRGKIMGWYREQFIYGAEKYGFPVHRPYASLTQSQKDLLWNGNKELKGINDFFDWVDTKKYKIQ